MPVIRSSCAWSISTATATATVIETVDVRVTARATGDAEVLRLSETGRQHRRVRRLHRDRDQRRGGRLRAAGRAQCRARRDLCRSDRRHATRRRPMRSSIRSASCSIRRPASPINGARVRLIDAATGLAATVFGDDGVSRYPSEMVTGQTVTDQGGTQYSMPAGVFRFPLVAPGNYRLEVLPPGSYRIPLAAHDRRPADAAGRAVSACSRVRSARTSSSPPRPPSRSTCRSIRPASRCCCARARASRSPPPAISCSTRSRCENNSEPGAFTNVQRGRPAAGRRALPRGLAAPERRAHRRSACSPPMARASPTRIRSSPLGEIIELRYVRRIHRGDARHEGRDQHRAGLRARATCARTKRARWCA